MIYHAPQQIEPKMEEEVNLDKKQTMNVISKVALVKAENTYWILRCIVSTVSKPSADWKQFSPALIICNVLDVP